MSAELEQWAVQLSATCTHDGCPNRVTGEHSSEEQTEPLVDMGTACATQIADRGWSARAVRLENGSVRALFYCRRHADDVVTPQTASAVLGESVIYVRQAGAA